jgi:hypothetical protein
MATFATAALREAVTKQQVWHVLHENDYTFKYSSVVPRRSVPLERREHLLTLRMIWTRPDMVRLSANRQSFGRQRATERRCALRFSWLFAVGVRGRKEISRRRDVRSLAGIWIRSCWPEAAAAVQQTAWLRAFCLASFSALAALSTNM